jgi:hypothetical protein
MSVFIVARANFAFHPKRARIAHPANLVQQRARVNRAQSANIKIKRARQRVRTALLGDFARRPAVRGVPRVRQIRDQLRGWTIVKSVPQVAPLPMANAKIVRLDFIAPRRRS